MYDKKVTITKMATGDCIPELTNARGKKKRNRHNTRDVIRVKVGGIGEATIFLHVPTKINLNKVNVGLGKHPFPES